MIEQLPYTLTKGVTATRDGLVFDVTAPVAMATCIAAEGHQSIRVGMRTTWTWPDAAERLRYREGEAFCWAHETWPTSFVMQDKTGADVKDFVGPALSRLAAMLCDDVESFRVLHWCVGNLGGESC